MGRRGLGALALLALPGAALAYGAGEIRSEYTANRTINVATQIDHSWTPTNDGTGVKVGRNFTMKAPGGRTVAAEATSLLSRGVVLRIAAKAVPVLAAGSLAWELYEAYRIGVPPGEVELFQDPGTPTTTVNCYRADQLWTAGGGVWSGQPCAPTIGQAAAAYVAWLNSSNVGDGSPPRFYRTAVWSLTSAPGTAGGYGTITVTWTNYNTNLTTTTTYESGGFRVYVSGTYQACPGWVDWYGLHYDLGESSPGYDGKCPAGQQSGALTPEEAAAIAEAHAIGSPDLAALTAEALGVVPYPISDPGLVEVGNVVPSTVEGPTTTEVFTDEFGQVRNTTTAVGWDWSRDPLRKNEGKWPATTTKTTRNLAGEVLGTTTTSEDGYTDEEQAEREAKGDMCKLNPDSAACAALGQVPGEAEVPEVERNLEITPVAGFGPSTAACPAPRSLNLALVGTVAMPFDLLCDYASGLRPLVIGFAWLSAVVAWLGLGRRGQG